MQLRRGDVLIGPRTGKRYEVLGFHGGEVSIQANGEPAERWTPEGLERNGYRKATGRAAEAAE
jgi:hypothetical protein